MGSVGITTAALCREIVGRTSYARIGDKGSPGGSSLGTPFARLMGGVGSPLLSWGRPITKRVAALAGDAPVVSAAVGPSVT